MTVKLSIKDVCKIFGEDSRKSLEMLRNGSTKEDILAATGQNVGVNNASFDIHEGEIFVIMGLSGSGKSTLVRMLNRLIEPTAGEILLNSVDIAKLSNDELIQVRRNAISMVFQSFALMPHMSVLENVCFGLELSGTSKSQREERALEALRQVGLEAYSESYPDELSGGMQQRVGLARALANDPEVLLMDEAFSALDPLIRTEMQDELVKLQADQKRTIVFISHDLDEAMRIGDRIAIMEGGRVVQVGTPDEILKNPADDYVRAFFRDVDVSNVLTAGDIATKHQVTIIEKETSGGVRSAIKRLSDYDRDWGYVLGKNKTFSGIVTPDSLQSQFENDGSIAAAMLSDVRTIKATESLNDIISTVASTPYGLPVINDEGIYLGVITRAHLLNTLDSEGVVTHGG